MEDESRASFRQLLLAAAVSLPIIAPGMSVGFSAIALPELRKTNSTLYLDVNQESWFASLWAIATPLGSLLSGPILDRFGRRSALLAINLPCFFGWFALASVPDSLAPVTQLYLGRLLTGLATGMSAIPSTVYLAEVVAPYNPGIKELLSTWPSIFMGFGVFLVYMLGSVSHWPNVATLCSIIPLLSTIVIMVFVPESPDWLRAQGRFGDAEWADQSLHRVRIKKSFLSSAPGGRNSETTHSQDDELLESTTGHGPAERCKVIIGKLLEPEAIKPFIIVNTFYFVQQFSGVYVMVAYMVEIIDGFHVDYVNSYLIAVIGGGLQLVSSVVASFALPTIGIRRIAMFSGTGMATSMFILATFLSTYGHPTNEDESINVGGIPLAALMLYLITSAAGFLILPGSMLGDCFPLSIRGVAGSLTTVLDYVWCFAAVKMFPYTMADGEQSPKVFYFYACVSLIGIAYAYWCLPDRHGTYMEEQRDIVDTRKSPKPSTSGWLRERGTDYQDLDSAL